MQCSVADSLLSAAEDDQLSWPHVREHAWIDCLLIQIPAWTGHGRRSSHGTADA
jgi:hypothetical protein